MSWEVHKPHIYEKWKQYWYSTHPPDIAEYSWNYLFTGGKEIRARLFCELWKYLSPDLMVCAELAFSIECIHTASLILDDTPWMDNATERRGKTTLHLVFTQKKAILLAHDVMYMVYLIWNENKPSHISLHDWELFMKDKLQRLMIGQWYDLERSGKLTDLASLKTGVLFELVTETVAVCTKLDQEFWKIWGNHLGILFQWMDDWQDREEDTLLHSRNAFNEAYDTTLLTYGQIWQKIERDIGVSWFQLPFGQFMRNYFTRGIPLPSQPLSVSSLSDLFLSYPTSHLPFLYHILPEWNTDEQRLYNILHDRNNVITINNKNILNIERDDILTILREKKQISIKINEKDIFEINIQDTILLDFIEILNLFTENHLVKLHGKKFIRGMLKISHRLHPHKDTLIAQYMNTYRTIKERLWLIQEEDWEIQPEIVDSIYHEIQLWKEGSGIVYQLQP